MPRVSTRRQVRINPDPQDQGPDDQEPPPQQPPPQAEEEGAEDPGPEEGADANDNEGATDDDEPTWESLLREANLERHEAAYKLGQVHASTSWTAALGPTVEAASRATPGNSAAARLSFLRRFSDSVGTTYFLVVVGGRVEVLYGLKACYESDHPGSRFMGLMGDHKARSNGTVIPPKLYRVAGAINNQMDAFDKVNLSALPADAIATSFSGDADLAVVPRPDGTNGHDLAVWKAMPVHPKIACLFMRGVSVRHAFALVRKTIASIPESARASAEELLDWICAAATTNNADPPGSQLGTNLTRVDHGETEGLENWYLDLVGAHAATAATSPVPSRSGPSTNAAANPASELARALQTAFSGSSRSRRSDDDDEPTDKARPYSYDERCTILQATGVERPYTGLDDNSVNDFFLRFREYRKNSREARLFLENWLEQRYPSHRIRYTFVFSSQTIKDLKQVTFRGGDPTTLWSNRHKGISIFAIAPLADDDTGDSTRDRMVQYEDTFANHMPKDRATQDGLSASTVSVPRDRASALRWIEFGEIWIEIFFGRHCPMLPSFRSVVKMLYSPRWTKNWKPADWYALIWAFHRGMRQFFIDNETLILERIDADLSGGWGCSKSFLPDELVALERKQPRTVSPGTSSGDDSEKSSSSSKNRNQKRPGSDEKPSADKRSTVGAEMAKAFQALIIRGEKALQPEPFLARRLCFGRDNVNAMFGPEFLALVPHRKNPCIKYFLFGSCSENRCHMCHDLTSNPSSEIINGIKQRILSRVEVLEKDPKA